MLFANHSDMQSPINVLVKLKLGSTPLLTVSKKNYAAWLKKQSGFTKNWLDANQFSAEAGKHCLIPAQDGKLGEVVCGIEDEPNIWSIAGLSTVLPPLTYHLATPVKPQQATQLALGWALGSYSFTRYKKKTKPVASLVAPKGCDMDYVESMAASINWARDLISTPANDMNPETLADEAAQFAKAARGKVSVITGEALLKQNYPTIYTVGKASSVAPRLVDIRFPRKGAKKVTLVGKGVTFDSGGLDIKPTSAMKLMKKDMAGAAIVLALAKTLVETNVPVDLRILLPIVENAVSGNAMRPLDIVKTRKGITVEIGNTDAEGRLILCDALAEADDEKPDLIIDCSTLTGAARVALGTDVPAFFTPDDKLADRMMKHSREENDPVWRLPLVKAYRPQLDTQAADLSNDPESGYGGAITAALYLQEFVTQTKSWLHLDMMAWNLTARPGRPKGAEAMAVRALYRLIKERCN